MRTFHLYHRETGLFVGKTFSTNLHDEGAARRFGELNTTDGHAMHEGPIADYASQKIDVTTGQVVDFQPPQPSEHHEWNDAAKRWTISAERQAKLDAHRDSLQKIGMLEVVQSRYLREVHLGVNVAKATARLKAIEEEIVELRKSILQELL